MLFNAASYRRSFLFALAFLVLVLCVLKGEGGNAAGQNASPTGEYQVKAAFVYNFIKFVTWPSREPSTETAVRLCILGELSDAAPFDGLDGRDIMGKRLHVVHLKDPQEARACQVLFLSSSVSRRLQETLDPLRRFPILTVGDTDGYAQRGVMINMYLENKRVRFDINAETARQAGLRISSKLLSLAGTVHGVSRSEQ